MKLMAKWLKLGLLAAVFVVALAQPLGAWASTYGSGTYGECAYSDGCAATSNSKPTPAAESPSQSDIILLNHFADYFTAAGKDLELSAGQIVYFDVTVNGKVERHSITIKAVSDNDVDIEIASNPIADKLVVGDRKQYDVTSDNQNDIEIALKSIADGKAKMNFRALAAFSTSKTVPHTTSNPSSHWWWWLLLGLFGLLLFAGLWWFFILWKRRRRDKDEKSVTTNRT